MQLTTAPAELDGFLDTEAGQIDFILINSKFKCTTVHSHMQLTTAPAELDGFLDTEAGQIDFIFVNYCFSFSSDYKIIVNYYSIMR